MTHPRSVVVQSVLFNSPVEDLLKAAVAVAHSAALAVDSIDISTWSLHLGDCSPTAILDPAAETLFRQAVEERGGTFFYEFFEENLGSAAGHNRLAAGSQSELLIILNPDAQVAADTVTQLARTCVGDIGMVEARQVPFEHPKEYEKYTGDTSWASTACAMTTRSAFDALNGFDSATFFLYCDDVDYSWRIRLSGLRVVYQPAAAVFHDKRLLVSGDWPASAAEIYYSAEAALMLAHKYSRRDVLSGLEARFERDPGEAVQKALSTFKARRSAGTLPAPIDPDHRVAQFVNGNYSAHRF